MKVRIVKCTDSKSSWYKKQIGSEFFVVNDTNDNDFYTIEGDDGDSVYHIRKQDCEILEINDAKPEPFDLERALKGDKVMTLDGRVVDEVIHVKSLKNYGNIIIICDGAYAFVDKNGKAQYNEWDVQMAPREPDYQTVWANLYSSNGVLEMGQDTYPERSIGEEIGNYNGEIAKYIGTFPITFKKP